MNKKSKSKSTYKPKRKFTPELPQYGYGSAIGAGAASGALSGGIAGSAVPGIGTAIGAVGGALIGGIGAAFSEKTKEDDMAKAKTLQDQQAAIAKSQQTNNMVNQGIGLVGNIGGQFANTGLKNTPSMPATVRSAQAPNPPTAPDLSQPIGPPIYTVKKYGGAIPQYGNGGIPYSPYYQQPNAERQQPPLDASILGRYQLDTGSHESGQDQQVNMPGGKGLLEKEEVFNVKPNGETHILSDKIKFKGSKETVAGESATFAKKLDKNIAKHGDYISKISKDTLELMIPGFKEGYAKGGIKEAVKMAKEIKDDTLFAKQEQLKEEKKFKALTRFEKKYGTMPQGEHMMPDGEMMYAKYGGTMPQFNTYGTSLQSNNGEMGETTPDNEVGEYRNGGLSRSDDFGSESRPYPNVSPNDFAGRGRSYPIPTRADAIDALRLAGLHGRSDVRSKVFAKYPELKHELGGIQKYPHGGYHPEEFGDVVPKAYSDPTGTYAPAPFGRMEQITGPMGEIQTGNQWRNANNYIDSWNSDKPWGTITPEQQAFNEQVQASAKANRVDYTGGDKLGSAIANPNRVRGELDEELNTMNNNTLDLTNGSDRSYIPKTGEILPKKDPFEITNSNRISIDQPIQNNRGIYSGPSSSLNLPFDTNVIGGPIFPRTMTTPINSSSTLPMNNLSKPINEFPPNSGFNYKSLLPIARKRAKYAPAAYNIGRGLFEKPVQYNPSDYYNKERLSYQDRQFDPSLIRQAQRVGNIASNRGAGSGSYMSNVQGNTANTQKALYQGQVATNEQNRLGRMGVDQYNSGLTGQNRAIDMQIAQINEANKATKRNMLAQGFSDLSQASQGKDTDKNYIQALIDSGLFKKDANGNLMKV